MLKAPQGHNVAGAVWVPAVNIHEPPWEPRMKHSFAGVARESTSGRPVTNTMLCYVVLRYVMMRQVPRVELQEMGPSIDFTLRRFREAVPDLAKEAHRQPKPQKKKVTLKPKP